MISSTYKVHNAVSTGIKNLMFWGFTMKISLAESHCFGVSHFWKNIFFAREKISAKKSEKKNFSSKIKSICLELQHNQRRASNSFSKLFFHQNKVWAEIKKLYRGYRLPHVLSQWAEGMTKSVIFCEGMTSCLSCPREGMTRKLWYCSSLYIVMYSKPVRMPYSTTRVIIIHISYR